MQISNNTILITGGATGIGLALAVEFLNIKVFEVSPPVVDTALDNGARDQRGQTNKGLKPEVVAKETQKGLGIDNYNIAVGQVNILRIIYRIIPAKIFQILNGKVKR